MRYKLWLATLGSLGYVQMPGTIATLATLPLVWAIRLLIPSFYGQIGFVALLTLASWYVIHDVLESFGHPDPKMIVLDELVGAFITFLWIPLSWKAMGLGFLFFRFFDITKWCGVKFFEKLPGAYGVVCDDVAAGILANIVLHGLDWYGFISIF